MIGKLKRLTFNQDGTQDITVTVNENFAETFDKLREKDINIDIKKFNAKRSLDMNAYCWVLIDRIAEATNKKKTDVYRDAIRDVGGVSTLVCAKNESVEKLMKEWSDHGTGWITETLPCKLKGCTLVRLYYGSSTYDSVQMKALIEVLIQDAEALGLPTMPRTERDELMKQWETKKEEKHE